MKQNLGFRRLTEFQIAFMIRTLFALMPHVARALLLVGGSQEKATEERQLRADEKRYGFSYIIQPIIKVT
ncbi:hypothetical protein EIKCOROL_01630 [Eikenella corrodens ATCC 23834]|jgi:hypothetical protein|uniref:Uncharacterized protein n=2 Tax=Eikenella corrodens TaxID=539 RepID=C0DW80_EIKCO|nr:hypothetical protein EIKCOROL_01630 [Eikenella corrodens ATCC 23834]